MSMNLQIAGSSFIPAEWVQGKTIFKRSPLDQGEAAIKLLAFQAFGRLDLARSENHESCRTASAGGFLFSMTTINGSMVARLDDQSLSLFN